MVTVRILKLRTLKRSLKFLRAIKAIIKLVWIGSYQCDTFSRCLYHLLSFVAKVYTNLRLNVDKRIYPDAFEDYSKNARL